MSDSSRKKPDWGTLDERMIGSDLGNFVITGMLGVGGMSTVYRAKEKLLDRQVALKVFPKRMAETEKDFLQAFLRDARTSSKITHPNVITIFYVGYAQELYYVAMELMEGGSLRDVLSKEGALPYERAVQYCIQAAQGLFAAHELGIVHRDVKPGNLMLTRDGHLKVADFGLAHHFDLDATIGEEHTMGTPLYMAPELCIGNSPTPRSDIYALGVTFFSLLANQKPYMANTVREVFKQHVESPIPDIQKIRPGLPRGLQTLINRAMAKRPLDRYRTCAELAEEFQKFLDQSAKPVGSTAPLEAEAIKSPGLPARSPPGMSETSKLRRTSAEETRSPLGEEKSKTGMSQSRFSVSTTRTIGAAAHAKIRLGLILAIVTVVAALGLGAMVYFNR